MEVLCSTGALIGRPNGRDYHLLEELAGRLSCDGFEFMMYDSWYGEQDEIVTFLRKLGLHIPVMHCEKRIGETISIGGAEGSAEAFRLFEINCRMARALRAEKLVLHLWDGLTSDSNFENNLEAYGELSRIAERYGIMILVENVVCNVGSPFGHWRQLAERYPDIGFVFDTKMAAFHQEEGLLYQPEYAWLWNRQHIRHYHVNDYGGGYKEWAKLRTLPIGAGHVDFGRFFDCVLRSGYDGTFTVEATAFGQDGRVDTKMLNGCFSKIRAYMGKEMMLSRKKVSS